MQKKLLFNIGYYGIMVVDLHNKKNYILDLIEEPYNNSGKKGANVVRLYGKQAIYDLKEAIDKIINHIENPTGE